MTVVGARHSLLSRAFILLGAISALCVVEVFLALTFKAKLKQDFFVITSLDERERDFLQGLAISSELANELSIPAKGMVFLRVSHWQSRLENLSEIEGRLGTPTAGPLRYASFAVAAADLNRLLEAKAGDDELADFAREAKRKVGQFSQRLRVDLAELKQRRASMIADYGRKSDEYAWILLAIGLSAFTIIVVTSGRFIIGLLRAINDLVLRAKEIAAGNYARQSTTTRKDEVGHLVESVNQMATSLDQREKEVEEVRRRLSQQEKIFTVGSFAAGIAHEVGNPIQAIMAINNQVLEDLIDDDSPAAVSRNIERLELVSQQAERLNSIIGDIREFAHTGMPDRQPVDINEVVRTTLRLMRFDARFRRVAVTFEPDGEIPPVNAVQDHLTQVLINLLINAADAVDGDDSEISIATAMNGKNVVVSVADNGRGMSPDVLAKATEPFFTTKERGKGTGLGLSVCKQIVTDHDGRFEIQSREGLGTTMTVHIPKALSKTENTGPIS